MRPNIYSNNISLWRPVRTWLPLLLALTITLMATSAAQAHATLVRSDPANSAVLTDPPQQVRLWFSESISAEFSAAQILNATGQTIQPVKIQVDSSDSHLMIITLPKLAPGLYSIRWRVLSESDGHFTQGPIVFGIGQGVQISTPVAASVEEALPWPEVTLRWVNYSALMGLVGAVAVTLLALKASAVRPVARRRTLKLAGWCAALGLLAGVGLLVWQVITVAQTLPEGVSSWQAGWQVLTRTRWGLLWLARQSLLLIAWAVIFRLTRPATDSTSRWWPVLLVGLPAAVVALQSLMGHAAAITPYTALAVVVNVLHMMAASVWVGGLAALCVGCLPLVRQNRAELAGPLRSFSGLAALSVSLLVATGLYSTGRQVASVDALIATPYGQALLSKISLMLLVGAIGLVNALLLHPTLAAPLARLLRHPAGWALLKLQHLPALVVAEAGLGLLVVLLTGMVTALPQARGPEFEINPDDIPTALSQSVDDMIIAFSASPNRPGQNIFTIRAASTRRPPPAEVMRVILRFTFLGREMGRTSADAVELEPGLYQLGGSYLSLAGPWQVQVIVRRAGVEDSIATFHWTVAPPGAPRPTLISRRALESALTLAAAAVLMIPLIALGRGSIGRNFKKQGAPNQRDDHEILHRVNEQIQPGRRPWRRYFAVRLRKQPAPGKYDIIG